MDTYLVVTSKRDTRRYSDRPIPPESAQRILDAGRLAGSARNRQPWRFLIVDDPHARERLAASVYEHDNVHGARLIVPIVGKAGLDTGRAAQNKMLVAWNEGIGSCPNGFSDPEAAHAALGLDPDEAISIVLTFGYPAKIRDPMSRTPEEWSARANRKPLDELIERL
jgi:nitroreductase